MPGHRVEASRLVAVEPAQAFDRLIAARLPEVFCRRYAAFPAIRDVADQPADWGSVGQTRTILLADGGSIRQTLTVGRPTGRATTTCSTRSRARFGHSCAPSTARWSVTPEGTGARIGWTWVLHPKASPARLTMSVIGRMWKGYAERALAELETVLMRA